MSEKNIIKPAIQLALNCRTCFGKFLNDNDVRQHPDIRFEYFPYVFVVLREFYDTKLNFKENLGHNSNEALGFAVKLYKFYKHSGKKLEDFPKYYLEVVLRIIESQFGDLTFNNTLSFGDYGKPDWKLINDQRVSLLAPTKFTNDTKFVGVYWQGKWRIDYEGNKFLSTERIDKQHVFVLSAEQRRNMIRFLTRNDNCLFDCYVSVFHKYPIEAEYRLYILNENPDHFVGVKDWFDRYGGEFL